MDELEWLREHLHRLEDGLQRLIKFAGPQVSYEIERSALEMMDIIEEFIDEQTPVYIPTNESS